MQVFIYDPSILTELKYIELSFKIRRAVSANPFVIECVGDY